MSEEAPADNVLLGSRPTLVSTRAAHLSPKLQRRGSSSARKFGKSSYTRDVIFSVFNHLLIHKLIVFYGYVFVRR
ncbi:hypothetical protein B9Z55_019867 [Caenorhabditis nigoni]|uniref:Uncharacterized protein n=1 Tax=Caenorhabditis nigoni TaxID=1611254 RepID=A0A2G5TKP6_9PELO|nr:hypothetical protein B9Z55_019867 [Caenorhabditis nigoni]